MHGKAALIIEKKRKRYTEILSKGLDAVHGNGMDPLIYNKVKLSPSNYVVVLTDSDKDNIKIYLDDLLLNEVSLDETINPDGRNPFLQPHYILLNLAIGANGGDPSGSSFPIKYEVDYVRVYQQN